MKKITMTIVGVVFIIVVSFLLFGAFNKNPQTNDVVLSYVDDDSQIQFNPQKEQGYNNLFVNLAANLAVFDKNGKTKPYASEKIVMSKDNKTLQIKLKKGLKFENGEEIGSNNYYEAIKLLANPKIKASYANWVTDNIIGGKSYFENKSSEINGFEIIDKLNFKIHLTKPLRYFKDMLVAINFAPVSPKFIKKVGILNYGTTWKNYLSSGPLKLKDYKKSQYLKYELNNNNVLAQNVKIKHLTIKFIGSDLSEAQLFKANKIDTIVKSDVVDQIMGYKRAQPGQSKQETPYMTYITTNAKSVNKNVATALNLSLDKNYLNQSFFSNAHKIRSVITPNNYSDLDKEINKLGINPNQNSYDLNKAKLLVQNEKKKNYVFYYDLTIKEEVIKYIEEQTKKIGLNISFEKLPSQILAQEVYKPYGERKFDFAIKSWGQDFSNPASFLEMLLDSKSSINIANYKNLEFDNLIRDAKNAPNDKIMNQKYAQAIKKVYEQNMLIPLYQRVKSYYIKKGSYDTNIIGRLGVVNNWIEIK